MKFKRYAIYYIPEMDAEFYKSGTKWLGWDVFTGKKIVNNKDHITKNARRYGFHGTLYPPFELKSKINFNDFEKSVDQFAKNKKAFDMGKGKITNLDQFIAICFNESEKKLKFFAADCIKYFHKYRKYPSQNELEKRRKIGLTKRQEKNLVEWGYPFVMEEFKFHMTLTGHLQDNEKKLIESKLKKIFISSFNNPIKFNSICLLGEDADNFFHFINRFYLSD